MDRQIIRLTESDLHNIVRKSVNRILKEGDEEWKSPLDKVRKNKKDWKEINKNKIQVPNKSKKAKPTTLGDLPQFEKLKNLNVENYIHGIVKETVNRMLKEASIYPGFDSSVTNGIGGEDDEFENDEFEATDEEQLEWRIDDVCMEFGSGEVLINGVLGLWDGKKRIQPTPCSDIRSAIQKCIGRDGEIMSPNDIEYDGETVSLKVSHHDGTNNFEITHYN